MNIVCTKIIDFQTFNVLRGFKKCPPVVIFVKHLGESSEIESEEDDDEGSSTSQDDKEAADGGKTDKPDSKPAKQNKPKPRDDLAMYEKFFPELFEFQVGLISYCVMNSNS